MSRPYNCPEKYSSVGSHCMSCEYRLSCSDYEAYRDDSSSPGSFRVYCPSCGESLDIYNEASIAWEFSCDNCGQMIRAVYVGNNLWRATRM